MKSSNRLVNETSPYLLQHAHNPVDWYPWGAEALERAKAEDKPILLSIGYAACHWCHVMERESFEDLVTAQFMNDNFVCIKVDREERPDIDSIYMDAVQAMTGHGGWPMTMFLTPAGKPFYGGTYFPPVESHGMPAFRRVLESVTTAWRERRDELETQGAKLVDHIDSMSRLQTSPEPLTESLVSSGASSIGESFDKTHGGFGGPPKFPQAPVLEFMLRAGASQMADLTLQKMAAGVIYDQIGGGFHRYSVDGRWLVPHFEKMLYDNAQLARLYAHAWQATHNPLYARITAETLEYLLRDMRDPAGGFYSSEDADSEGVEGKFYVWNHDEFVSVAPEAAGYYGVSQSGNWEGANILVATGEEPPDGSRARLLEVRSTRVRPTRDEKVLASWNGLAIGAFAEAGAALGRSDFIAAAESAAAFVMDSMRSESRLLHSYKDGQARVLGLLEDYAYLADGLITLWEATFEPRWINEAGELIRQMLDLFWDTGGGGLYTTGGDHEALIVRQKELVESATPAPMGVASLAMQRMAVITGDADLANRGGDILRLAQSLMERAPQAVPTYLSATDFWLSTPKEVVIVGGESSPASTDLFRTVWKTFLPNKVLAGAPPGIDSPLLEGKAALNGLPTAFVCENYACLTPTGDPQELVNQLRG